MWTYESNGSGYMLFKDGAPQGGASTMLGKRRRPWQHVRADVRMFAQQAAQICTQRNAAPKGMQG